MSLLHSSSNVNQIQNNVSQSITHNTTYLGEVPVNSNSFLKRFVAVVQARLVVFVAVVRQTAISIVLMGLDPTNVKLTSLSEMCVLMRKKTKRTYTKTTFSLITCFIQHIKVCCLTYLRPIVVAGVCNRCVAWNRTLVYTHVGIKVLQLNMGEICLT